MPLPKNWIATFSGEKTFGDEVLTFTPEEFMVFAVLSGKRPSFIFAGAYYDLRINGFAERADAFLALARRRFPEYDWSWLILFVDYAVYEGRKTKHRRPIETVFGG